jgi:putative NADH-flavin reductase
MNILILGATGRTGRLVASLAIQRGHSVTVFVRSKSDMNDQKTVRMIVGDPTSAVELTDAVDGQDAVISCLGLSASIEGNLLSDSSRALIAAMYGRSMRYVVISQGLLFSSRNPLIFLLRAVLHRHVKSSYDMESVIQKSALNWTIVRAPRLTDSSTSRGYVKAVNARPKGLWSMHRIDLANAMIDQVESKPDTRKIIGVTTRSSYKSDIR